MKGLEEKLAERFGEAALSRLEQTEEGCIDLLQIRLQKRTEVTLLMTQGLSDYKMPVLHKHEGYEHNELYFCLPGYWDLNDRNNPRMNWVISWLNRLVKHVQEKETWYGVGHTIPAGTPDSTLSDTMKQSYFFLDHPRFVEQELRAVVLDDKTVHFLAVIPIFEDEFDYKMGKGTLKLQQKLQQQGVTELLDDYRSTVLSNRWRVFRNKMW